MPDSQSKITVFISYSHRDEQFKESLEEHLAVLRRSGKIDSWSDRKILPGTSWAMEIDSHVETADVILLLVSSSFIASGYCYEKELARALERHEKETAVVVPIFVRPTDLTDEPIMSLQGLPKDAKSVSEWSNEDLAWRDVAKGIRSVVDEMCKRKGRRNYSGGLSSLQETLAELVENLDRRYNSDAAIGGLSTGLVDMDRAIDGLHPGQLVTLAARPGMGRTNLALGIAAAVALAEAPVVIFSTKTSRADVMKRLITIIGRVSYARLGRGLMTDEDWSRMTFAGQRLADSPMLLDDSTEIDLHALRDQCLTAKNRFRAKLGLVVVDSVHYLTAKRGSEGREGTIAKGLKALARELDCAILATVPISRSSETRPNKRPSHADLGDWRELGDESDVLAFLYRDEVYNFDSPDRGTAELIIARNQHGPIGPIRLLHTAEWGLFADFALLPKVEGDERGP